MSNWVTKFFEKPDWRLVKEIQADYIHYQFRREAPDERVNENEHEMTYYLYEDQDGNRKFDVVDGMLGDIDVNSEAAKKTWTFRSEEYRYTIRPWLDGRTDPDIPRWDKVKQHDFKRILDDKK